MKVQESTTLAVSIGIDSGALFISLIVSYGSLVMNASGDCSNRDLVYFWVYEGSIFVIKQKFVFVGAVFLTGAMNAGFYLFCWRAVPGRNHSEMKVYTTLNP